MVMTGGCPKDFGDKEMGVRNLSKDVEYHIKNRGNGSCQDLELTEDTVSD